MFEKLIAIFKEQGWAHRVYEDIPDTITFGLSTDRANFRCYTSISPNYDLVAAIIYHPIRIPDSSDKRNQIVELCNQFNYNLVLGNLEVTPENYIRFRITTFFEENALPSETIVRMINLGISFMDDVVDLTNELMYNSIDIREAIERANGLYGIDVKS